MKHMMKWLAVALVLCAVAPTVYANGEAPVIYNRTVIKIVPKPGSTATPPAPAKDQKDKKAEVQAQPRTTKEFVVDMRPLQFLSQEGFIAQQSFTDKGGMLVIIDPPDITVLKATSLLARTDVLFVRKDGLITKIAPDLSLSNLEEPISSEEPIHAFLFLKANTAKLQDIRPGDHVENALFKAHPVILDESSIPAPTPAPAPAPDATQAPQK